MLIYIGIFFITVLFYCFSEKIKNKRMTIFLAIIILALLALITGTRLVGGYDYSVYERGYRYASNLSQFNKQIFDGSILNLYGLDLGYTYFIAICKSIGLTFYQFTLVVSIFFYFSVYYNFKKINVNMIFVIIVFLYKAFLDLTFVYMRQSIAVGIFLFAIYYLKKRKIVPYIFICLLATMFHSSALALILLYPFTLVKVTKRRILIYCFLLIPTYFLTYFNINVLNNGLFNYFLSMGSLGSKVLYFSSSSDVYRVSILHLIEYILIIIPIYMHFQEFISIDDDVELYLKIFLFILPFYTILSGNEILIRIKWYCILFYPVVIYYLKYVHFKYKQIFILFTICLCFVGMVRFASSFDDGKGVGEYRSYLVNDIN